MVLVSPRRRLVGAIAGAVVVSAGAAVAVDLSLADAGRDPVRLAAEIDHRYRTDEAARVMPVLLRNTGDEPVTIAGLELVAPSVVTKPETDSITVRPGLMRRMRLPLRPARCPDRGAPSSGPAAVVVAVASSGDASREVRLPAPDPENALDRFAQADCDVQRVLRAADIDFGTQWQRVNDGDEPLLRGQLVLARGSAGSPVTVTGIRGGVMFVLRASSEPPWRLDGDDRRLAVPIEFTANRCDRHAMFEAKTRFVFSAWAKLPDEEKQHVTLQPDPRLKAQLRQLIADTCERR